MLTSSCVVIEERLDPDKMRGIHQKYQGKGDYAGDLTKVPCTKEEQHIGLRQIFPVIHHPEWRTSTVKHHCPRTAVASSLRAMSNKVLPNPSTQALFTCWFKNVFEPEFESYLDEQEWIVDFDEWLLKYPGEYQKKIRKGYAYENREEEPWAYEAFAKIEQQFTETPHIYKDTCENTVKERQICGPLDQAKAMANAFINKLEEVAHKHCKEYCGRKNWLDICKDFDQDEADNPDRLSHEEDFSGYDMTLIRWIQILMMEFKIKMLRHKNVTLKYPINIEDIELVFLNSIDCRISVDHGMFIYYASNRQSGQGWTTFDNSILNVAFNHYLYFIAKIPRTEYFMCCKGDDSIKRHSVKFSEQYTRAHSEIFSSNGDSQTHGLGQIIKVSKTGPLDTLSFLSNHFFITDNGCYRMTRIPARVIQTLSWTTKLPKSIVGDKLENSRRELCYSKGMCLLAWGKGLPIWQVLGEKMVQLGKPGKMTEYNRYVDEQRVWHDRDDRLAYLRYLHDRYLVTPEDVTNIENKIRKVNSLTGVLEIPEFLKFYTDQFA